MAIAAGSGTRLLDLESTPEQSYTRCRRGLAVPDELSCLLCPAKSAQPLMAQAAVQIRVDNRAVSDVMISKCLKKFIQCLAPRDKESSRSKWRPAVGSCICNCTSSLPPNRFLFASPAAPLSSEALCGCWARGDQLGTLWTLVAWTPTRSESVLYTIGAEKEDDIVCLCRRNACRCKLPLWRGQRPKRQANVVITPTVTTDGMQEKRDILSSEIGAYLAGTPNRELLSSRLLASSPALLRESGSSGRCRVMKINSGTCERGVPSKDIPCNKNKRAS